MNFIRGFKYALKGILYTVNHERNMRIHITVAAYLFYFLSYYSLTNYEMALLLLVAALVICLELVNTAVERVCDFCSGGKYSRLIEAAKDAAAGAVLIAAVFAVVIACFMLWKPDTVWMIIVFHCSSPERFTLLVLTVVIALLFIIIGPKKMLENAKSWFSRRKKEK